MKQLIYYILLSCVALFLSCSAQKHIPVAKSNGPEPIVLVNPHQQPYYLNGGSEGLLSDLYTALSKTVPVTQDSVNGRALVSFRISEEGIIDTTGIKIMRIIRSVPDDYLNAAIEAIKTLGKFEPGKINGMPKTVTWNQPIEYPIPVKFIKKSE